MKFLMFLFMAFGVPLSSHADGAKPGDIITFKLVTYDGVRTPNPIVKTCTFDAIAKGAPYENQPYVWGFESMDKNCWQDFTLYVQPSVGRGASFVSIDEFMKYCGTDYPYRAMANTKLVTVDFMGQQVSACDDSPWIWSAASPINVLKQLKGGRGGNGWRAEFYVVGFRRK